MVKQVLRSAEKLSEPFPLSLLPLYLSPKPSLVRQPLGFLFLQIFDAKRTLTDPKPTLIEGQWLKKAQSLVHVSQGSEGPPP